MPPMQPRGDRAMLVANEFLAAEEAETCAGYWLAATPGAPVQHIDDWQTFGFMCDKSGEFAESVALALEITSIAIEQDAAIPFEAQKRAVMHFRSQQDILSAHLRLGFKTLMMALEETPAMEEPS